MRDRIAYAGLCGKRLVVVLYEFPHQHVGSAFDFFRSAARQRHGLLGGRGRACRCGRHVRRGATKRLPTSAASAYPAALSAAHTGVISGEGGFDKPAMDLTDELKQDSRLYACAARSTRFYKARDRPSKFVQLGTVLQGRDDFYTSRLVQ